MIREIGVELQAELKKQGVPFVVVDGPEPTKTTTWGRERIVIEYDADGTDSLGAPRSISINPKRRYESLEACKLTIYAQSTASGSLVAEHRRRAKLVRDEVLVALELVAAKRKNRFVPGTGRLITPPDLAETERAGGAVYELKFGYSRAVEARTWAGAKRAEGTVGGVTSTTKASLTGADDDTDPNNVPASAETACGA